MHERASSPSTTSFKKVVRASLGAALGSVPGLVLLGLTVPVSGEAELTLGALGLVGTVIGALTGTMVAIGTHRRPGGSE